MKKETLNKIHEMSVKDRIEKAEEILYKLEDHYYYALSIYHHNEMINFSPVLVRQMKGQEKGVETVFCHFQQALIEREILKVYSLWDEEDWDKICIPTVMALLGLTGERKKRGCP